MDYLETLRNDAKLAEEFDICLLYTSPAYGSWVSALAKGYQNLSPEEQKQVNNQYLQQ